MIKKKYKCRQCGYGFVVEIFESQEEIEELVRRDPRKRPTGIRCPRCKAFM